MNQLTLLAWTKSLSKHTLLQHCRLLLFCGLLLLPAACSFSRAQPAEGYRPVRAPYPTFTPTPVNAQLPEGEDHNATNPQVVNTPQAVPLNTNQPAAVDTATPTEIPTTIPTTAAAPTPAPPHLVVSSPLVNVRSGPGTEYPVLTTIERGQEFDIVGKNAAGDWWRFCCVNNESAWVIDELIEVDGAVDAVPVSDAIAQVSPTATAAEIASQPEAPAEPAPTEPPPAPAFGFVLENAEQFPENKLVRVFLYVFDSEQALGGYSVRVTKDGAELPVSATSVSGQPSLTWPIADSRQRSQNMKVEFPGIQAPGTWVVQLVDGGGNLVGPPATFTLAGNDPNQELYVRYKKL